MSSLIVEVCRVEAVRQHVNADRLEIARVKGWDVCVPKGLYEPGSACVYFPPDCVLPAELSDRLGITKYLTPVNDDNVAVIGRSRRPGKGFKVPEASNNPSRRHVERMARYANQCNEDRLHGLACEVRRDLASVGQPPLLDLARWILRAMDRKPARRLSTLIGLSRHEAWGVALALTPRGSGKHARIIAARDGLARLIEELRRSSASATAS